MFKTEPNKFLKFLYIKLAGTISPLQCISKLLTGNPREQIFMVKLFKLIKVCPVCRQTNASKLKLSHSLQSTQFKKSYKSLIFFLQGGTSSSELNEFYN